MAKKRHAGKKKYVNPVEQQKQQEAAYKKLFLDKLRNLCRQIENVSLYNIIPPEEKLIMYFMRSAPLKVVVAPGAKIQKRLMDALVKIIKSQQLVMKLEVLKDSGEMMTFADYALVGMPLEFHAGESEADYRGKELFAQYAALRDEREEAYEQGILGICALACWIFEDIEKQYVYTYKFESSIPAVDSGYRVPQPSQNTNAASINREWQSIQKQDFRIHPKITIGTYPLEVRKVTIDGETHSAIQTGMLLHTDNEATFFPFTLSLEDLHVKTPFSKLGLPIYIQQHALTRMKERIGKVIPCFYKTILTDAFIRKEFVFMPKSRMLIACYTNELKIGYFVAELVDGIVLIRTFLLLTNGGTPEGDKLAQLTGLEADDRKYLSIDTLQGLANSDITQNENICNLFCAAGCGSILELCKKINNEPAMMWLLDKSQPKNMIADLIDEYLKPNDGEEEYVS